MLPRSWRALVAALLAGVLLPLSATAADDTIVGSDGNTYPAAPAVVEGENGELFWGRAFDLFCADGAGNFAHSYAQLAQLAKVIRSSGRRVVFVVAPDKVHVSGENLARADLPHGRCDRRGIRKHGRLLRSYDDPSHLAITGVLDKDPRKVFWKTDTHWTTVGASVFAKGLATALDPDLGARQKYRAGKNVRALGPLAASLGRTKKETLPTALPAGGVTVTTAPGSEDLDDAPYVVDHSWTSTPASATWPGRTLLLGDSFMFIALPTVRPIFHRGRFMWVGHHDQDVIDKAVVRADTVVLEVAQFFLTASTMTQDSFWKSVRRALRAAE